MRGLRALLLAVLAAARPAEASAGAPAEASSELAQSCGAPEDTRGSSLVQCRQHLGRVSVEAEALEELEQPAPPMLQGIVLPAREGKGSGNASMQGGAAGNASDARTISARVSAAAVYSCPSTCQWCGPSASASQVVMTSDVKYGQALNWATGLQEDLFLDIYEVPSAAVKPVLVAVHGGSFSVTSTKTSAWAPAVAALLAQHGFLAVSIEYRRYGEHCKQAPCGRMDPNPKYEAAVHDVLAAVRYIRKNAAALKADPNRIALFGCSAGGTTISHAMMNAWGEGSSGNAGYSSEVQAGIALSGTCRTAYLRKASGVAPYLAFHNEIDSSVPYSDAVATRAYLDSIGTPDKLITLAGSGHCPNIFNGVGSRMQDFMGFLVEYLQLPGNTCPSGAAPPTSLPPLTPTATPTPLPTPAPMPAVTPAPMPAVTPVPTPAVTPAPAPASTPAPALASTLSPTMVPTLAPTPATTLEPRLPSPTPQPTLAPSPAPTPLPTPSPAPSSTCPAECSAPLCKKWDGCKSVWTGKRKLCVGYCNDLGGQMWCLTMDLGVGAAVDCTSCGASGNGKLTTPAPPVIVPHAFVPVNGGLNRVCRGASEDDDGPGYWTMRSLGSNALEECQRLCVASSGCAGVNVNRELGRCEVWTSPISASRARAGWACYRYE